MKESDQPTIDSAEAFMRVLQSSCEIQSRTHTQMLLPNAHHIFPSTGDTYPRHCSNLTWGISDFELH